MQIVSQLEIQLKKEQDRLSAMMEHLHPGQGAKETIKAEREVNPQKSSPSVPKEEIHEPYISNGTSRASEVSREHQSMMEHTASLLGLSGLSGLVNPFSQSGSQARSPLLGLNGNGMVMPGSGRGRRPSGNGLASSGLMEKHREIKPCECPSFICPDFKGSLLSFSPSAPYHSEESRSLPRSQDGRASGSSNLDIENEIARNRDFYRANDVRPPFTYAALIRQVRPSKYSCLKHGYLIYILNSRASLNLPTGS